MKEQENSHKEHKKAALFRSFIPLFFFVRLFAVSYYFSHLIMQLPLKKIVIGIVLLLVMLWGWQEAQHFTAVRSEHVFKKALKQSDLLPE